MYNAGTSMATPMVSGAAAIIRQYFSNGWHLNGKANASAGFSPKASLVKAVLINSGQALVGIESQTGSVTKSSAYDFHQGFGRINLLNSLPLSGENHIEGLFVNNAIMQNGKTDQYPVTIDNSGGCDAPLSATLVWTDPVVASFCNNGCK